MEKSHIVEALRDAGLREAEHPAICMHAEKSSAVILTKDDDFAPRAEQGPEVPVIVWLRVGNSSNAALRAWSEPRLPGIVQLVGQASRLVAVV